MLPKLKILFLCTGNSCRSQIAEAWTRRLHPDRFEAQSAGTRPGALDPRAVRVMEEEGLSMAGHRAKHVDEVAGAGLDVVITVCDRARESCPVLPGVTRQIHAGFDDPPHLAAKATGEEEALAIYRRVRDEIRAFVEALPARLASCPARSEERGGDR